MPDWVHAVVMIFLWIGIGLFIGTRVDGVLGVIWGVMVGYLVAGQVVQKIPGFWKDKDGNDIRREPEEEEDDGKKESL